MKDLYTYIAEVKRLSDLKGKSISNIEVGGIPIYVCLFFYEDKYYGKVYFMCFIGKDIDKISGADKAHRNIVYRIYPTITTGEIMEELIRSVNKKGRDCFKSFNWFVSTPYLFDISDKIESSTNTYINNLLKELCNNLNNTFDGYAFLPVTDKKDIVSILKEYCK